MSRDMRPAPRRADVARAAETVDVASDATDRPDESGVMARLWPALLAGNAAWSLHLVVSYYLAHAACAGGDGWLAALRHLATLAAVAVTVVGWRRGQWASGPRAEGAGGRGEPPETAAQRVFLARLATLLSAMFLFAIVMTGAANFFLVPCR